MLCSIQLGFRQQVTIAGQRIGLSIHCSHQLLDYAPVLQYTFQRTHLRMLRLIRACICVGVSTSPPRGAVFSYYA